MPSLSSVALRPTMPVHVSQHADKVPEAANTKPSEWKIALKIVQKVAMASLKEFAIALAFAAVTCTFVATPAGASVLIITALAVVALNTLIRAQGVSLPTSSIASRIKNPSATSSAAPL